MCFNHQDTLYEIVNKMREGHSYTALVLENTQLKGLITEHDVLLYLLSQLSAPSHSQERVSKAFNILRANDVMIPHPITINADVCIQDAFDKMIKLGFRYVPVVDKNHLPIGVLHRNELTQYMQIKNRKELESKDMMLSYLMHHENYGCV